MGTTRSISGVPSVSVPVLSRITVRASPSRSIAAPPLTMTPTRAARDTPERMATGAARMRGQGVATTSTARPRTGSPLEHPGQPGGYQGDGQEEGRIAIRHADEGRLVALGLAHETDDTCVCALRSGSRRPQLERFAGVRRSAADGRSLLEGNGERLARERRLVENGLAAHDEPVDGDDLAVPDHDVVADRQRLDGDLFDPFADPAVRDPRRAPDQ